MLPKPFDDAPIMPSASSFFVTLARNLACNRRCSTCRGRGEKPQFQAGSGQLRYQVVSCWSCDGSGWARRKHPAWLARLAKRVRR